MAGQALALVGDASVPSLCSPFGAGFFARGSNNLQASADTSGPSLNTTSARMAACRGVSPSW